MKRLLSQIGVYLIAVVVGCLVVEIGYRVHLLLKDDRVQLRPRTIAELPVIGVYNRSLWRFDEAEGFQYVREPIFITHIAAGRITSCERTPPINKYGSPGLAEGNYEDAEIKIAVFGDSVTAFTDANNMAWVNYLQRDLQKRLGRSVHVLNFARDGIGLAQMFDIAAIKVPKYKPDLAIIAAATSNMGWARIWRVEKVINGELRVLTTFAPTHDPDLNSSYETYILHPEAAGTWCEAHKSGGPLDSIGMEMIGKYLRFRPQRYEALTPYRSFFWHRIVHADPFYSDADRSIANHPITPEGMQKDRQLIAAIATLNQTAIPYVLIHLPFYPEVKSGQEFSVPIMAQIARQIGRMTGRPMQGLLDYIPHPVPNPERMNHSPENMHPSTWGMQMYADAVSEIVLKNGIH
jgi:lysophospholipase L1-like esterase